MKSQTGYTLKTNRIVESLNISLTCLGKAAVDILSEKFL